MSSSENKKTTPFIPILTEIIDAPTQGDLGFQADERSNVDEIEEHSQERGKVSFFHTDVFIDESVAVNVEEQSKVQRSPQPIEPFMDTKSRLAEENLKKHDHLSSQKITGHSSEGWGASTQSSPEWSRSRHTMTTSSSEKVNEFLRDDQLDEKENSSFDSIFEQQGEDEEIFSSLAHNPVANKDNLRPSDLMLLALTERIASKVRLRVSKDLDTHIQRKIFPLLDGFADQLVKHLEVDLLKIIREGIAEATREELERLSQRGKK